MRIRHCAHPKTDTVDAPAEELDALNKLSASFGMPLVYGAQTIEHVNSALPEAERFSFWDLYRVSDFALYPSDFEGFGNALLEVCDDSISPARAARVDVRGRVHART